MKKLRNEIGILIAEDHPILRAGLRRVLESQRGLRVLGEAVDGVQTLALARKLRPQILLLDIRMPGLSGLEVLRELKASPMPVHTLVLSVGLEREQILKALQLGARGIILRYSAADVLLEGVRSVAAGEYWVCGKRVPNVMRAMLEFKPDTDTLAGWQKFCLTGRQTEIIALVEGGYTNKDIAKKLNLGEQAVKNQLVNIFHKLGVSNRLELVLFSIDHHLTRNLCTRAD